MDLLVILGRVFSNEPLERTMYMIVIWVGLLLLSQITGLNMLMRESVFLMCGMFSSLLLHFR